MSKKQFPNKPKAKEVAILADSIALKKLKISLGIIVAAFAFILYAQSISFKYTMDDPYVLNENSLTTQGLKGIPMILKTDYWYGRNDNNFRVPEYRPAPLVFYVIAWQFFPDNSSVFHFMNVFFFALTCFLIFILLYKLLTQKNIFRDRSNLVFAFICSMLYAAHPIHTEVVDSIKSLDEILCFMFGILSMYFAVKFTEKNFFIWIFLSAISFFFSLLSKETGISFIIIIPMLLFVFTMIGNKKILMVTMTLITVCGVFFLIRYIILKDVPKNNGNIDSTLNNSLTAAPDFISQKATEFYILLRYVLLLIFPHPLSCDYSFNEIPIKQILNPLVIGGFLLYLFMAVYAFIKLIKNEIVAFAILFFLITLAPVSNIFIIIGSTMAERFMYIPSLGYCILLANLLMKFIKTDNTKNKFTTIQEMIKGNIILFLIAFVITVLYSIKTYSRSTDWKDDISLFAHDVEVVENSGRVHYNYAKDLSTKLYPNEKNPELRKAYIEKAIIEYGNAINVFGNLFPSAYNDMGCALGEVKRYDEAISSFEKATLFDTNYVEAYINKGLTFIDKGDNLNALKAFDKAEKLVPDNPDIHFKKGLVLFNLNKFEEAIYNFQFCIDSKYKDFFSYKNIGACYINLGKNETAIKSLTTACSLAPDDIECMNYLGVAYKNIGNISKANEYFEKAKRGIEVQK